MRHSTIPLVLAAMAMATFAGAQLSQEYKDWPDSLAGYLLTKAEHKAYGDLKTDAEAKQFIDLFWARRDPNLDTPVNEFKSDYELFTEAADRYFSYGNTKGSRTDRGRTLLLLGKYAQRVIYRPGELPTQGGEQRDRGEVPGGAEVWKYTKDQIPKGVKLDDVIFVFAETRSGAGDFVLDRGDRRNSGAVRVLAAAPDALLLHPKLTEVPRLGMLPGSKSANPQQLAVLGVEPRPWPQGSVAMGAPGILSEVIHPFWLFVQLPDSVPVAAQAVGRAIDAATGKEAGNFIVAVKPVTTPGGNAYEFAFPLDPGTWKIELALLGDAGPVAITSYDAAVEAAPREGTFISPFYWGVDIRQEAQAKLGDAFNIGGWHVVPRVNNTYTQGEQLSYFCFVLRPGMPEPPAQADPAAPAAAPKPKLEVSMLFFAGEKKLTEAPATPVNVSQIRGELWMYGNGMPLDWIRKPGDYRLMITLRDTITNVSRTTVVPVTIPAPLAVAPSAPAAPPTGS
jgi:GWxTD domain-containing protein